MGAGEGAKCNRLRSGGQGETVREVAHKLFFKRPIRYTSDQKGDPCLIPPRPEGAYCDDLPGLPE